MFFKLSQCPQRIQLCIFSRPIIYLNNGDLTIRTESGKNISLETIGKGTVLLNGIDLSEATKMVEIFLYFI